MNTDDDTRRSGESLFFEANPNPMFIFAVDDLRLLAVNEAMVAQYGWSRAELLEMTAADLRPPEEMPRLLSVLGTQTGFRAESAGEWRHRRKDGTCFDAEVTLSGLEYMGRDARLVMANDLTRRKRAEAALRRSEKQLRLFIRYAPAEIAMLDRGMSFLAASRRWVEYYGIRGGIVGRTFDDVFPDVPKHWRDLLERGLSGEEMRSEGEPIGFADGSTRWLRWEMQPWREAEGEIGGILLTTEDITARRRAEEAVRESEQKFRGTFENAAVGMAHVAPDGTWLRVNNKLCEIVGYPREELLDRSFEDITHPDDLQNDWHNARRAIQGEIDSYSSEKRYIHKDGSIRWISLTVSLVRKPDGQPDYFISVMRDIGERMKALGKLADSERRFRAMTEKAAEDVILMDAAGKVLYESPNEETLLGYPQGVMTGRNGFDLVHPGDRPLIDGVFRELMREAGASRQGEIRMMHRDGKVNWVRYYATNLLGDPAVGGVVLNLHNITQRKQAEEALRAAEKRLAGVVAHLSEGLIMADTEGRHTSWNPAALAMFGFDSEEECLRQTARFGEIFEVRSLRDDRPIPPDEWPFARIVRAGALRDYVLRVSRPDQGWEKIISYSGAMVRDIDGVDLTFISTTDVTEARNAEAAVRASEERFRTLVSVITDIPWTTDPLGRFITPQKAWARYTGQTWGQHRDFGWADALHPDDRAAVRQTWQRACEARAIYATEGRLWNDATKDYRHFIARAVPILGADGSVKEWVGTCTDVHERKLAELRIREREAMLRTLTNHADVGMVMITRDHRYAFANAAYHKIHGLTGRDIVGMRVEEVQPLTYETRIAPRLEKAFDGQRVTEELRFPPREEGGPDRWFAVTVNPPVETRHGPCAIVVVVDITARKLAEEQIRRVNEELEVRVRERTADLAAANRELETFSYSVSHDLRAPLRALDGFSQILLLDHADHLDEQAKDYLGRIRSASQRMGELIDALLRLARVSRGEIHLETVDLSATARAVADELGAADPHRRVEWIIAPDLTARGDPRLLRVLLENLLGNAWKYTARNTSARIEFGARDEDGRRVWFVRDDGAGFENSQADRLFTPFQRLHKSTDFKGIGIGLATVRRIVGRHGGTIRAEGEPGRGALFEFTLAATDPREPGTR